MENLCPSKEATVIVFIYYKNPELPVVLLSIYFIRVRRLLCMGQAQYGDNLNSLSFQRVENFTNACPRSVTLEICWI